MPSRADARAALQATLSETGIEVPLRLRYDEWEEAFVERWHMVPEFNSRMALTYLVNRGLDPRFVTCVQAMHAYYVNQFQPIELRNRQWVDDLLRDMQKIPPEIVEPEPDEHTLRKRDDEWQKFNPDNPARRGRKIFDMSPDR